ncbi:MAG TPA: hypothetical protein VK140_07145 [Ktedonobacteraceae bacterium]|jgi:hypothetical protein|nr:hypothetical protein [Ktedonobacteraceae bacterium]
MALSISKDTARDNADALHISMFPTSGLLETREQIRRFELLRLAFFVLKLRKLEQRGQTNGGTRGIAPKEQAPVQGQVHDERDFRASLLRHVIFQQVLTLIQLDAREQALQIIDACQK